MIFRALSLEKCCGGNWPGDMSSTVQAENFDVPHEVNFVSQGEGAPVIMIHGLAASLHDWDSLVPKLARAGYAGHALDLLGHGDSPKPDVRDYQVDWLFDHFMFWMGTLNLDRPPVLIGHSLGGFIALEFAKRFPGQTRGLILVDPVYSMDQFPLFMRFVYRRPALSGWIVHKTPQWLLRAIIDLSSLSVGHSAGGLYALPREIREQTVRDYIRTAPGVYNVLNEKLEFTSFLTSISIPALVIWGDQDRTLKPASFEKLVAALPNARGRSIRAGHVPHQSDADWFDRAALDFLASLCQ
jgi:pimeloyl-ACP methyl ester carboxylesterase